MKILQGYFKNNIPYSPYKRSFFVRSSLMSEVRRVGKDTLWTEFLIKFCATYNEHSSNNSTSHHKTKQNKNSNNKRLKHDPFSQGRCNQQAVMHIIFSVPVSLTVVTWVCSFCKKPLNCIVVPCAL